MNPFLLNIILHALASAPAMIDDLSKALSANWNVPHVEQARQGIAVLAQLASDLDPNKPQPQPVGEVAQPVAVDKSADPSV